MPLLDYHWPPSPSLIYTIWPSLGIFLILFILLLCDLHFALTCMYKNPPEQWASIIMPSVQAASKFLWQTVKMWEQVTDSPRHRHNLTLVSSIWEALPISLFRGPNGLNKLPEMSVEYPFNLLGKSAMAFITGQSWCICLKSWYTQSATKLLRHCTQIG